MFLNMRWGPSGVGGILAEVKLQGNPETLKTIAAKAVLKILGCPIGMVDNCRFALE